MIMPLIIAAAFGLLGLVFFAPVVRTLERNPKWLIGGALCLFAVAPFFESDHIPMLALGPINVNIFDPFSVLLLALSFPTLYAKVLRGFTKNDVPLLLFLAWYVILGVNLLLGVKTYGLQTAINEFRVYLYIIATFAFVSSLNVNRLLPELSKMWMYTAACLMLAAVFGYADGNLTREDRPLDSHPTYFLLQAGIIGLFLWRAHCLRPALYPVALACFPFIVLLQHRSVWAVTLFSVVIIFLFMPELRSMLLKVGAVAAVVFGTLAFAFFGEAISGAISTSYKEAVNVDNVGSNTLFWRFEGWKNLLSGEQMDSPREILLGNSFGRGWEREVTTSSGESIKKNVTPHNYYIQNLLRSGVLGTCVWLASIFLILKGLIVMPKSGDYFQNANLCLFILIASQLVFLTVYGWDQFMAILLAVGYRLAYPEPLEAVSP